MNAAADLILVVLLRGVLLGACAWLLLQVLRRRSAELRHRVLLLALLTLLVMPGVIALCAGWKVLPALPVTTEPTPMPVASLPVIVSSPLPHDAPPARSEQTSRPLSRVEGPVYEQRTVKWPLRSYLPRWQTGVVSIWALGAGLCLLGILRALLRLRALVRECEPADAALLDQAARLAGSPLRIKLLVASEDTGPMAAGFLRPVLVLPEDFCDWDDERARAVLLHELAHARRRDGLLHLLAALTCALHWANPLAWWMLRRLQHEAECTCDNAVLAAAMPAPDYAGHLLAVATSGRAVVALAPSMARPSGLRLRVQAVLSSQVRRGALGRMAGLLVLLSALLLALPMMLAQTAPPKTTPPPKPAPAEQPKTAKPPTPPAEQTKADNATKPPAENHASVQATVVDENGQPLAGAELRLFKMDKPGPVKPLQPDFVVSTDTQGRWQGELPFGEFILSATHNGRVAAYERGQTWWYPNKKNRALKPRLVLRPGGSVEVLVLNAATRQPVADTPVYLDAGLAVKTDANGIARLSPVSLGEHTIMAVAPPLADRMIDINLQTTGTTKQQIELSPGFAVQGRALNEKGEPVKGAEVRDNYSGSTLLLATRHAVTDEDGRYQLGWYAKSKPLWSFQIEHDDFAMQSVSELPPPEEGDVVTHNFFLDKGHEIAGVVKDTEGKPVKGASVRYGSSWSLVGLRSANSGADGHFRITKIGRTEQREIVVEAKGFAPAWQEATPGKGDAVLQLAFTLTPGLTVKGRMVDAQGKPVTGMTLSTRALINGRSEYCGPRVGVNEKGEFVLESQPATGASLDAYGGGISDVRDFKFDPTKPVVVTVDRPGVIRGRVVDAATGQPVDRFTARLNQPKTKPAAGEPSASYSAHLSGRGQACEAADGTFVIQDLISRAGHAVFIEADGYVMWQRDLVKAAPTDDKAWPLEIALERGVTLPVEVVDAFTGNPLAGAKVYFVDSDLNTLRIPQGALLSGDPRDYGDGGRVRMLSTGPDGRCELHLPADTTHSTLVVRAEKHPPVLLEDVHRGAGSLLRVEMLPEARITGSVAGLPGFDPAKDSVSIESGRQNIRIKVAPDGSFTQGGLSAGQAVIRADARNDITTLGCCVVPLTEGSTTRVDLVNDSKASFTVAVTQGGQPVKGGRIYVHLLDQKSANRSLLAHAILGEDGMVKLERLPAVKMRVMYIGKQGGQHDADIDLADPDHAAVLRLAW